MARRGFFAELQHQKQLEAKRQAQAARAQARARAAAEREAERTLRQSERAAAQYAKASAAERAALEKEAKRLHEEARLAEAASLNAQLAETADKLGSILGATLELDDFVDLERFRVKAKHPPFPRDDLEIVTPAAQVVTTPPEPSQVEVEAPTGMSALFGGKKKHAEAVAAVQEAFAVEHEAWQAEVAAVPGRQLAEAKKRDALEEKRLIALERAREKYQQACEEREAVAAAANGELDILIDGVAKGVDSAIQEYIGIVLSNSVYPEILSVEHEFEFDTDLKELSLTVLVTPPERLPEEKEYGFVKARDEVTASLLPKKDLKERYADVIHQVALRSVHEIFEADRTGHVNTIALSVAADGTDPATGLPQRKTLVAVAAERSTFMRFDLSNIVPLATLRHLGASVSKSPYDLVGVDGSQGVRSR